MSNSLNSTIRTALLVLAFAACRVLSAQIPTKCLEIERILVDACIDLSVCPAAQEGQNEMVSFRTGPQATALSELEADWPNNNWNGLVQNATTATLTATLNATIAACGHLLEPPAGIIPPGSRVLLVTSTAMCAEANPFTNLTDTIYLVFQAPGNTSGHFANHNNGSTVSPTPSGGSALRTLILTYLPTACSDTATYDRELLTNVLGSYGGNTAQNDGATAVFSWPGVPQVSYVNFGCQAPIVPTEVLVDQMTGSLCAGSGTVQLEASVTGPYTSVQWSGGAGSISDPTSLSTSYTAGANDVDPVTLTLCATLPCGDPVCTTVTLPSGTAPTVSITPDGPTALCPGQSVTLTASGADSYLWGDQQTSASITVSQAGTYTVTGTNACGSADGQIAITVGSAPTVTITPDGPTALCPGESVTLTAGGADSYLWNDQQTSASISVSVPGTYSVTGTNGCGNASAQITITAASGPTVSITPDGSTTLCPGESVVLTATGADSYLWDDQQTSASITVTQPGTYSVTGTNGCGQGNAQITITAGAVPAVSITPDGATTLCPGESVTLTASGASTYLWSTQQAGPSITVSSAGTYSVTGTNGCGQDNASIDVDAIELSASFTPSVTFGTAPLTVVFTNTSDPADANSWDFDGDGTSTSTSPTHTFNDAGVYTVVLTITAQGCTATAEATIIVSAVPVGASVLTVPNVFSPNGDRVNDQLRVLAENMTTLSMLIYNRWGEKVGELKSPRDAWDARSFAGEPVPDGTYFYVLNATGADGVDYDLSGAITLIR